MIWVLRFISSVVFDSLVKTVRREHSKFRADNESAGSVFTLPSAGSADSLWGLKL